MSARDCECCLHLLHPVNSFRLCVSQSRLQTMQKPCLVLVFNNEAVLFINIHLGVSFVFFHRPFCMTQTWTTLSAACWSWDPH